MAQRIITELLDDLDGQPGAETMRFALDGTSYEVELTADKIDEVHRFLGNIISVARKVDAPRAGRPPRAGAGVRDYDPAAVREWARSVGIEVTPRGRLSAATVNDYRIAHRLNTSHP